MTFRDWAVWGWDWPTAIVAALIVGFFVIEALTSEFSPIDSWRGQMVTDHLRPIFHAQPLTWWLAFGVWLWLGPHFLFPPLEQWLARVVGGS